MKRISLKHVFLSCILMLSILAYSQEEIADEHFEYKSIGLRLGGNYMTIGLQPAIGDVSSEIGYSGGLVYIFSNKKHVGIQLEANYSLRNWKETFDDGSAITSLHFIEIPFMTNINLGKGRFKYIINLGSYLSFQVNKSLDLTIPEENVYYQSIKDRNERNSDFGLLIGGALRYLTDKGIYQLDVRYAYGYQKMYNEDVTGFRFSNMSGVHIGLIYSLNLKK